MMITHTNPYPRLATLAIAIGGALTIAPIHAEQTTFASGAVAQTLPEVVVKGTRKKKDDAAPTRGSLNATQPTSVIDRSYIENVQAPTANYSDIVAIAPSVVNIQPNGPGLGDTANLSIRGFTDGQYNLTWDGIPVGDANDFTHHSADYLMPQDLGKAVIDRGPGSASTIGFATFGGTLGVETKAPLPEATTTISGSVGSFATHLVSAEFDTGRLANYGDFSAFIDAHQMHSDGYLTGANLDRKNLFVKGVGALDDNTRLTFVAMYNKSTGNSSALHGATSFPYVAVNNGTPPFTSSLPGQMQIFGNNYGLSSNPQSQAFTGYNHDDIATDLEYFGLQTKWGSVAIDNKLYTFAYYHHGYNGSDPNGGGCDYGQINCQVPDGTFPAGADTPNGTVYGPNDIPGQRMYNDYRNWGDLLRLSQTLGPGELHYGIWYNRQNYHRYQAEVDYSNDLAFNNVVPVDAIDRYINGTLTTIQPYIEYVWSITPKLKATVGVKYADFNRHDDSPIEQKTRKPLNYSQTWKKALPSIDLHYQIDPDWSAYAQAAKGYLAPNEKLFYVPNPQVSNQNVAPETTTNFQLGTVWRTDRASLAAALYSIDFSNLVKSTKVAGVTYFSNFGGVRYRGAEVEGSYALGAGFSLYGNASLNRAIVSDTGLQLTATPRLTAAAGVLYHDGGWDASLIAKHIGSNWGDTGKDASGRAIDIYRIGATTVADFAVHYTFRESGLLPRDSKLGLQVFNVTDTHKIDALAGYTAGNVPLFYGVPGRSVIGSFSIALH